MKTLIVILTLLSNYVMAETEIGNGGDLVVCFKDRSSADQVKENLRYNRQDPDGQIDPLDRVDTALITTATLLDLWEGQFLDGRDIIDTNEDTQVIYDKQVKKASYSDAYFERKQTKPSNYFTNRLGKAIKGLGFIDKWVKVHNGLRSIPDSRHIVSFPKECVLIQAARQVDHKVYVDSRLLEKMNNVDRAALQVHEHLLHILPKKRDTRAIRKIVAFIFSKNLENDSGSGYLSQVYKQFYANEGDHGPRGIDLNDKITFLDYYLSKGGTGWNHELQRKYVEQRFYTKHNATFILGGREVSLGSFCDDKELVDWLGCEFLQLNFRAPYDNEQAVSLRSMKGLVRPITIEDMGYPLPLYDEAIFYPSGRLLSTKLKEDLIYKGYEVSKKVEFFESGDLKGFYSGKKDLKIQGVTVNDWISLYKSGELLGARAPSDRALKIKAYHLRPHKNFQLYKSGKLKAFFQRSGEVKIGKYYCRAWGDHGGPAHSGLIHLYENGKLKHCMSTRKQKVNGIRYQKGEMIKLSKEE